MLAILLCVVMVVTIFSLIVTTNASAAVSVEWIARYDDQRIDGDPRNNMAIDSNGNVYVTGSMSYEDTGIDYTTVAYDSSGNELWSARYNGKEFGIDEPYAIATDSSGNVYVTGTSYGGGTGEDYSDCTTIAYDSSGNELWVARYNGPGDYWERGEDIATDSSGNIYVTGFGWDGIGYDYITIAYDSSGNELWVARYNSPGNGWDCAVAIAIDSLGNVYVTGPSNGKCTTIAYDSSGNQLWIAIYDDPRSSSDYPWAIVTDSSGNVYVTGWSTFNPPNWDYITIAYDSSGNELWVAKYNAYGNERDQAHDIAVDSSGNIFVTGISYSKTTDFDSLTIAYDSSGNELWVGRYNGPGNGRDTTYYIATDSYGNVYVSGSSYSNMNDYDYITIAYDPSGKELWIAGYNGPGNGSDYTRGLAIDSSRNIYVSGFSTGNGTGLNFATIKYSQTFPNQSLVEDAGSDPILSDENITSIGVEPSQITPNQPPNENASSDPVVYDGIVLSSEEDIDEGPESYNEAARSKDLYPFPIQVNMTVLVIVFILLLSMIITYIEEKSSSHKFQ